MPSPIPSSIPSVRDLGAYLKEQRENAQLSVRQLSKAAGISNPYLSQIERGLRRPSAEILQALAKGLEISAESLFVRAGLLDADDEHGSRVGVREAIGGDPLLSPRQRRLMLDLYDSFVRRDDEPTPGPTPTVTPAPTAEVAGVAPAGADTDTATATRVARRRPVTAPPAKASAATAPGKARPSGPRPISPLKEQDTP